MDPSTEEKNPYVLDQKLFPNLNDDKIITIEFLEASKGVVKLVDKFGKLFSPLSYDMDGNIGKLEKCYQKNPSQFHYIENLLLNDDVNDSLLCVDALLWLKRALDFMLVFFQTIVNDKDKTEALQEHITLAYSQTLEPHHGWVTKKFFRFFRRAVPDRTPLLSHLVNIENCPEDVILRDLNIYLQSLDVNISHINSFYKQHNLESDKKAP